MAIYNPLYNKEIEVKDYKSEAKQALKSNNLNSYLESLNIVELSNLISIYKNNDNNGDQKHILDESYKHMANYLERLKSIIIKLYNSEDYFMHLLLPIGKENIYMLITYLENKENKKADEMLFLHWIKNNIHAYNLDEYWFNSEFIASLINRNNMSEEDARRLFSYYNTDYLNDLSIVLNNTIYETSIEKTFNEKKIKMKRN